MLKLLEPPEMKPFAHHRMQPAIEFLLFVRISVVAISEMLHAAHAFTTAGTGHGHHDAPNWTRKPGLVEQRVDFLLRSLGISEPAGMPNLKIDDDFMVCRDFRDQRKHAPHRLGQA